MHLIVTILVNLLSTIVAVILSIVFLIQTAYFSFYSMHITAIREARNSEQSTLEKCSKTLRLKRQKFRKRPIFSSQKKQLDERFNAISERVESFSSIEKVSGSKHIRFNSSSSEDSDSDDSTDFGQNNNTVVGSQSNSLSQSGKSSDRVSSCPYPSASEELTRLKLRGDMPSHSPINASLKKGLDGPPKKKRKSENVTGTKSAPSKLLKKENREVEAIPLDNCDKNNVASSPEENLSIDKESLQMFVTTWKDACWGNSVAEVVSFLDSKIIIL